MSTAGIIRATAFRTLRRAVPGIAKTAHAARSRTRPIETLRTSDESISIDPAASSHGRGFSARSEAPQRNIATAAEQAEADLAKAHFDLLALEVGGPPCCRRSP